MSKKSHAWDQVTNTLSFTFDWSGRWGEFFRPITELKEAKLVSSRTLKARTKSGLESR